MERKSSGRWAFAKMKIYFSKRPITGNSIGPCNKHVANTFDWTWAMPNPNQCERSSKLFDLPSMGKVNKPAIMKEVDIWRNFCGQNFSTAADFSSSSSVLSPITLMRFPSSKSIKFRYLINRFTARQI